MVASPLRRSWEAAWIVSGGAPVRLEADFREVHFGRWEGLTKEEIEARIRCSSRTGRQSRGFEYPAGEPRADFRARVERGLSRLEDSGASSALVVVHKGVIRTIAERLLGEPLADGEPGLGGTSASPAAPTAAGSAAAAAATRPPSREAA